ncbi:MAG: DUF3000 family protein [Bifidobacteriaceae bacterium]|jgi:hypothetical protein|nr:DUF3000 family protein [Bifidobacteriaceae bacterium]
MRAVSKYTKNSHLDAPCDEKCNSPGEFCVTVCAVESAIKHKLKTEIHEFDQPNDSNAKYPKFSKLPKIQSPFTNSYSMQILLDEYTKGRFYALHNDELIDELQSNSRFTSVFTFPIDESTANDIVFPEATVSLVQEVFEDLSAIYIDGALSINNENTFTESGILRTKNNANLRISWSTAEVTHETVSTQFLALIELIERLAGILR